MNLFLIDRYKIYIYILTSTWGGLHEEVPCTLQAIFISEATVASIRFGEDNLGVSCLFYVL